jgi:hypothetical protein
MRSFDSLSEREVLALAISLEEEDERIYADFAEGLREDFPATAAIFAGMREEESGHRRRLLELSRAKFGDHIPLIRRQDVRGFVDRKPVWLFCARSVSTTVRKQAAHGGRNPPFLRARLRPQPGCRHSPAARRPRAGGAGARAPRRGAQEDKLQPSAKEGRRRPTGACSCCRSCSRAWPD